jgi:transposase InsO family protein
VPLWVKVEVKGGEVPSLRDTGAQFSCIRRDVLLTVKKLGVIVKTEACKLACSLANGLEYEIREAVVLHFSLGPGLWSFQFKVLEEGPFPMILGLDFLSYSQMVLDLAQHKYHFSFAPDKLMKFEDLVSDVLDKKGVEKNRYFKQLAVEASRVVTLTTVCQKPCGTKRKGVPGALGISSNQKGVGCSDPPDIKSHRRQERLLHIGQELPPVCRSLERCQKEDSWCKEVRDRLENGDPAMNKYQLYNRLVCYHPRGVKARRYVVPAQLRPMLIKYFQDSPLSGHLGMFKTWKKVSRQFYWPKLKEDVFQHVRTCDLCQRAKPTQDTKGGWHSATPATVNLERIFIDFMGPLSRTKKGHRAIMVVMDSFSKFVAFFPVRRITAEVVCEVLETQYFKAYGIPKSLETDNAKVFKSKKFYDFCFQWGVRRIHTTPYYPQGSLAERDMRNLKAALKIFHHQTQDRWDEDLHLLTFCLQ